MPTLQFKGKNIIWNHHLAVPFYKLDELPELLFQPEKAKTACEASGNLISDHFVDINKTINIPKGTCFRRFSSYNYNQSQGLCN